MRTTSTLLARAAVLAGVAGIGALGATLGCGGSGAGAAQPPGIPVFYGDGSAGPVVVSGLTVVGGRNNQFTDVTVPVGEILNVRSGTVIRCTGTFTVLGRVDVFTGGKGGTLDAGVDIGAGVLVPSNRPASQGMASSVATQGAVGGTSAACVGGAGGLGLGVGTEVVRFPSPSAGGAGAGACGSPGGSGGGGLTVLAFGAITVASGGEIGADGNRGDGGGGGGAGGIIVLASANSVSIAGLVHANGGGGGASDTDSAPGGGGGGGVVNVLAPTISGLPGTNIDTTGGPGGSAGAAGSVTDAFRSGGGGGGGCGGSGGSAGGVTPADTPSGANNGAPGDVALILADPTGLFP